MSTAPSSRFHSPNAGNVATVTVVGIAFLVTWIGYLAERKAGDTPTFSGVALGVATALGIIYLILLLNGYALLRPFAGRHVIIVTLGLLTLLLLFIEFLLSGANGIWLISMPLIAMAATDLPRGPRMLVYAAATAGVVLPGYMHYGSWEYSFFITLTFVTAFVFVIAFVRLTKAAELAQTRAEHLAAELADANRRLGDFAVQAEELATMQERNRLAREIHDNLGHYLTVANVQIKAAQALLMSDPARANASLDKAAQSTQDGLAAVRQSVSSLRDSPLGRRTLPEAIAQLVTDTQASGLVAELHIQGQSYALDPRADLTLYRAAQEALTNTRKHSHASRVDLTLDYSREDYITLIVRDNGIGSVEKDQPVGFGLLGLQERARQLGGQLITATAPGNGYCLTVELPTHHPNSAPGEDI